MIESGALGESDEVPAVVAKLAGEDPRAGDDAGAALEWITGEEGLAGLTQERVQNFCWYELPMKWLIGREEKLAVAGALGQALELLQLPGTRPSASRLPRGTSWRPTRPPPRRARPLSAGRLPPQASSRPICRTMGRGDGLAGSLRAVVSG